MSNTIHAYGELLTASENDRILSYKLLTFNESGRTNKGTLTVAKDVLKVPADISHLVVNTEHKADAPIGRFVTLEQREDALYATVTVSDFERGNEALQAARAGELTGISVEVRNPLIRNGKLLDGELTGAALCKTPAFPSSMLMAADAGDIEAKLAALQDALTALTESLAPESEPEAEAADTEEPQSEDTEAEPFVPEDERNKPLNASAGATQMKEDDMSETPAAPAATLFAANASTAPQASALEEFSNMLAEGASLGASGALHAALTDITKANSYDKTAVPAYVGELYQTGRNYTPKFSVLLGQKPLTATKIKGWKFDVLPKVAYDYAGFPAEIGTNAPTVVEVETTAAQLAGGHAIDRLTLTLNDGGYVAGYLRECADDFDRKLDTLALDKINSTAVAVTGVGGSAYHKLLKGAQLIAETGTPQWAIVGSDLWIEILETVDANKLALLSTSIGLTEGALAGFKLIPAPLSRTDLNGKVIVGSSKALEMYTLPGGPVRVNAEDVSRNGQLNGVWGAYAFLEHDKRELVKVS
ncbi:hypothetical protein [Arthrobacter sp. QXT-31]|uniref:hypothetical protein n=1 Tax=Arthrobacter sp. QXT-31 TaxID=1357915 RepID=UPI000971A04F|nr:hypothetical protein [Arthrobacter sp. QXT-31]APX03375.1 hypothetical protein BWQ92_18090 [Arthrobacter sp. QXT-31]